MGPNYLVMELVKGEAPKGPLPLQTALNYARQIADALDSAHEKGIVDRDLKLGNIKIRTDATDQGTRLLSGENRLIQVGGNGPPESHSLADDADGPLTETAAALVREYFYRSEQ